MHFILKQKKNIEKWDKIVADTEREMSVISPRGTLFRETQNANFVILIAFQVMALVKQMSMF